MNKFLIALIVAGCALYGILTGYEHGFADGKRKGFIEARKEQQSSERIVYHIYNDSAPPGYQVNPEYLKMLNEQDTNYKPLISKPKL